MTSISLQYDKFYTNIEKIKPIFSQYYSSKYKSYYFVEPSAGNGALIDLMKSFGITKILAYDILPERADITKKDFFNVKIPNIIEDKKIITFMNPPFGTSCNLAIKFFNQAAGYSKEIWQIVPKTFKKNSTQKKLHENFHLVFSEDLPNKSFLLDGVPYDVPCCFQVWVKKQQLRLLEEPKLSSNFFSFVDKNEATHAIRRVGGRAGTLLEGIDYSESSTYFIKITNEEVLEVLKNLNLKDIVSNTVGVRSLSKNELVCYVEEKMSAKN